MPISIRPGSSPFLRILLRRIEGEPVLRLRSIETRSGYFGIDGLNVPTAVYQTSAGIDRNADTIRRWGRKPEVIGDQKQPTKNKYDSRQDSGSGEARTAGERWREFRVGGSPPRRSVIRHQGIF